MTSSRFARPVELGAAAFLAAAGRESPAEAASRNGRPQEPVVATPATQ